MLFNIKPNFAHFLCTLHNEAIHDIPYSKFLGMIINSKLLWSKFIDKITNKTSQVHAGFFLVKPVLEYTFVVWALYAYALSQCRARGFVFNDYTHLALQNCCND